MEIAARGLVFDVKVGGADEATPIVLLHGFPQNAVLWDGVSPALHRAGLRTIAPDQRGYSPGARPAEVSAYAQEECVADVVAILDALGHDRAHVVGHDWGAVVGWGLAARFPARVRTLTAVSVPHPRAIGNALLTDPGQREKMSYVVLFRQAGKAEDVLLDDDARRLRGMLSRTGPHVNRYAAPLLAPGALTGALNWYRAFDLLDPLAVDPVGVPTTFVWGEEDVAVGRAAAENCAEQVTGDYRFVALPGIGHYVVDEAPDALTAEILARVDTG